MKIKNVKIKNFKGLKIIDVSTETNMIVISGPNGAGKSSFCDAIMTALAGKDKSISRPIRNGASRANIEIELDGYIVKKSFSQSGNPSLTVTPTDNTQPLKSPQAWLNSHIGNLKFDPSEFAKLKKSEQRELLMELAGLNLDEYSQAVELIFNQRKFLNQELKTMSVPTPEDIKLVKEYEDKEEVSVSELSAKYTEKVEEHNRFLNTQGQMINATNEIVELKKRIVELEEQHKTLSLVKDTDVNIEELKCEIEDADSYNKKIRDVETLRNRIIAFDNKKQEVADKSEELEIARTDKQDKINAAKYPIEGLSVSDDGVLYNEVPFVQINDSQKIVIGTLIALALMPEDNPIKVIFIKLGSLLDDNALAYLEKVSLEQNCQIVIEFVGGDKGFQIVEGEIIN